MSLSCVNPAGTDLESYAGKWYGDYLSTTDPEPVPKEMEFSIDVNGTKISGGGTFGGSTSPDSTYLIAGTISDTGFSAECTNDKINPGHEIVITIEGIFADNTSASGIYTTTFDGDQNDTGTFSITKADSGA